MVDYFLSLYATREGDDRPVIECLSRKITDEQNESLVRPVDVDEVSLSRRVRTRTQMDYSTPAASRK
nr:uncharacterized protein LOC109162266 [Ipomoea trifida]